MPTTAEKKEWLRGSTYAKAIRESAVKPKGNVMEQLKKDLSSFFHGGSLAHKRKIHDIFLKHATAVGVTPTELCESFLKHVTELVDRGENRLIPNQIRADVAGIEEEKDIYSTRLFTVILERDLLLAKVHQALMSNPTAKSLTEIVPEGMSKDKFRKSALYLIEKPVFAEAKKAYYNIVEASRKSLSNRPKRGEDYAKELLEIVEALYNKGIPVIDEKGVIMGPKEMGRIAYELGITDGKTKVMNIFSKLRSTHIEGIDWRRAPEELIERW
ncbi:MAG: hypothetical protein J7K68_06515 [Candidatus Diapherotrites archaeon]|nr:hypothetical protein [Candidatus Diapherotrites archaeon]